MAINEIDGMGFNGTVADPVTEEEVEYLRRNWERTNPGGDLFNRQARMHASIIIVLNHLRSQERSINPSLLVIRECIRELRQYEA